MATSDEDSDDQQSWVELFCGLKGNEFFCEVDRSFIEDSFNLYGLKNMVNHYQSCMDLLLDRENLDDVQDDEMRQSATQLYGLIHARFILTTHGLNRMHAKYKCGDFGVCPRMLCRDQKVVPMGTHTEVEQDTVKVYCPRCSETYTTCRAVNSSLSPHALRLDGAYFGPTFPHLFFMTFDDEVREAARVQEAYTPRVYGFRVHSSSSSTLASAVQRIARDDDSTRGGSSIVPSSRHRTRSHHSSHHRDRSSRGASASSAGPPSHQGSYHQQRSSSKICSSNDASHHGRHDPAAAAVDGSANNGNNFGSRHKSHSQSTSAPLSAGAAGGTGGTLSTRQALETFEGAAESIGSSNSSSRSKPAKDALASHPPAASHLSQPNAKRMRTAS